MSTTELKNKVLQRLESIDDAYLFEEILCYLDTESKNEPVNIPEHYKEQLEKSIAQKKAGNTIPNEKVEQSIEAWLHPVHAT